MVTGHTEQQRRLQKILEAKRYPSLLLFLGEPGIGKFTVATHFLADYVSKHTATPRDGLDCLIKDEKQSHIKIYRSTEGKLSVDEVRQITEESRRPPTGIPHKWLVIDNAEDLSIEAANALLKTLEDTPRRTRFIMISGNEAKVLPTIKGRAFTLQFYPLTISQIKEHLVQQGIAPEEAYTTAVLSGGVLARALALTHNKDNIRLLKTVTEWFTKWNERPISLMASIDEVFDDFDRLAVYTVVRLLITELWCTLECGTIPSNPYLSKEDALNTALSFKTAGLTALQELVQELEDIKVSLNDAMQIKSWFYSCQKRI